MGLKKERQFLRAALLLSSVGAAAALICYHSDGPLLWRTLQGICALIMLALAIVAIDIARLAPADSHTVRTVLAQYLALRLMVLVGWFLYRRFDANSKNMAATQEDILLRQIIRPNADTEFGRRFDFASISSRDDYRRKVPLSTYADYVPYVERMSADERQLTGLLSNTPAVFMAVTSGSTGRNKLIPITTNVCHRGRCLICISFYLLSRVKPLSLQRWFRLGYRPVVRKTDSGLLQAPISFLLGKPLPFSPIPPEVYEITDEQTALYVQALLTLADPEVSLINGFMSTLVWSFWRVIESRWRQICDDIELGELNADVSVERGIRQAINRSLTANPARATQVRDAFVPGCYGLAKRIWPGLQTVVMFSTGGFVHYTRLLAEQELAGVYIHCHLHGASECAFGININSALSNPLRVRYTSLCIAFQEFLSISGEGQTSEPTVCWPEQVEIGKCYEIICTNFSGLYRYRMGDVVKIVDFHNQCPIYEFQYRIGHVLNVCWEKTPENVFYDALVNACNRLQFTLIDYTATENASLSFHPEFKKTNQKHYVVFLEASLADGSPANMSKEDKLVVDSSLCQHMELYGTLRDNQTIAPLEVMEVNPGTFQRLRLVLSSPLKSQQQKMPRVLRNSDHLSLLLSERRKAV